jgi:hypothetical protein
MSTLLIFEIMYTPYPIGWSFASGFLKSFGAHPPSWTDLLFVVWFLSHGLEELNS